MKINSLLLFLLVSCISIANSQTIDGLWLVEKVTVGDEIMTPIARWFRLKPNGVQESGNGWFQHSKGTWNYDNVKGEFSSQDPLGLKDEYGEFSVEREGENMTWHRIEDGMQVTVHLKLVYEIPKGPGDKLIGLWQLNNEGKASFAEGSTLFLRWDKKFVENSTEGKNFGFWHIHAHKPELTLLDQFSDRRRVFQIKDITDHSITLQGMEEEIEVLFSFDRRNSF